MSELLAGVGDSLVLLAGKGGLVALLGLLASRCLARATASARHVVWSGVLAGLLLLPAVSLWAPSLALPLLPRTTGSRVASLAHGAIGGERDHPSSIPDLAREATLLRQRGPLPSDWARFVGAVYLTGVAGALLYSLLGLVAIWRLTRAAEPAAVSADWCRLLASRPAGSRTLRRSRLVSSRSLPAPVTWGFWRPTVILPDEARTWRPSHRRRALLHELAHIERRDWATQIVARLVCALYWFHPLVWLVARLQALEAERACDDRVLLDGAESAEYAEQLLGLARQLKTRCHWPAAAVPMARRPSHLRRRIRSILDPRRRRSPMSQSSRILLLLLTCMPVVLIGPTRLVPAAAHELAGDHEPPAELMRAAAAGDSQAVRSLIERGADVDRHFPGDGSPLIAAALSGSRETVELLLAAGADVNADVPGDGNALIMAAAAGHLEVVRLLIESGADIDRVVPGDENPLIQAAGGGHLAVVRDLIEQGADVDVSVLANGREIRTPLGQAAKHHHARVAQLLRTAGAREQ